MQQNVGGWETKLFGQVPKKGNFVFFSRMTEAGSFPCDPAPFAILGGRWDEASTF